MPPSDFTSPRKTHHLAPCIPSVRQRRPKSVSSAPFGTLHLPTDKASSLQSSGGTLSVHLVHAAVTQPTPADLLSVLPTPFGTERQLRDHVVENPPLDSSLERLAARLSYQGESQIKEHHTSRSPLQRSAQVNGGELRQLAHRKGFWTTLQCALQVSKWNTSITKRDCILAKHTKSTDSLIQGAKAVSAERELRRDPSAPGTVTTSTYTAPVIAIPAEPSTLLLEQVCTTSPTSEDTTSLEASTGPLYARRDMSRSPPGFQCLLIPWRDCGAPALNTPGAHYQEHVGRHAKASASPSQHRRGKLGNRIATCLWQPSSGRNLEAKCQNCTQALCKTTKSDTVSRHCEREEQAVSPLCIGTAYVEDWNDQSDSSSSADGSECDEGFHDTPMTSPCSAPQKRSDCLQRSSPLESWCPWIDGQADVRRDHGEDQIPIDASIEQDDETGCELDFLD
ncbi:hypothetical protein BDY17DRAFT_54067 [Neohortaea acidophila]|uniref:Uncharacterized protein n=1 Tax=Neohortaea acidophila TaxID=245834 RepID=A0A6A6PH41_9PEZI|nr:uncharacterized protein BDY17DRAFT_54067 [Neohortaea acidophila]KAF2479312.1 hypothetical protein BDY17DRAFT_54067 [Neohortaea acidophila]